MPTVTVTLPRAECLSMNDARVHWATKARKVKALRTRGRIAAHGLTPVERPCVRKITLFWPDNRRRDDENLAAMTCKALTDGVVDAGLLVDDSRKWIVSTTTTSRVDPTIRRGWVRIQMDFVPCEHDWLDEGGTTCIHCGEHDPLRGEACDGEA